jgi:hypothetical protein
MKIIILFVLGCVFLNCCFGFNDQQFLRAVAIVETNNDDRAIGKAGERGRYQFMAATWGQYSKIPHTNCAAYPAEIERVAQTHLNWIKKTLKKNGYEISVDNCAAIWNAGWGNFRKGFQPKTYIRKVKANYESLF